jgi:antitoxin (DNA-binding transcriptional repressor) of toxin-antitoxin stability system
MALAAKGEEIIITHRGQPYVRMLPANVGAKPPQAYPLRGSVIHMAEDFDAPLPELWTALDP